MKNILETQFKSKAVMRLAFMLRDAQIVQVDQLSNSRRDHGVFGTVSTIVSSDITVDMITPHGRMSLTFPLAEALMEEATGAKE